MQAARKLHIDRSSPSTSKDTPTDDKDVGKSDINNCDDMAEQEEFENVDKDDDTDKNTEIRRLSTTDEGNKVLEPSFHSPEKEDKKNPLQNILNFVSEMELPAEQNNEPAPPPKTRGRKKLQYSMLNPIVSSQSTSLYKNIASSVMNSVATSNISYIQAGALTASPQVLMAAPTAVSLQPATAVAASPQQQVMQLVQTINGPVLVPVGYQTVLPGSSLPIQVQQQPPQEGQTFDHSSSNNSSPISSRNSSPKGAKARKRKNSNSSLTSGDARDDSTASQVIQQAGGPGIIHQQPVMPNSLVMTSTASGSQPVVIQQSPSTLVAVPAAQPQGIIYQQLPDGRMIQLQNSQLPMLQGSGAQVLPSSQLVIGNPVQPQYIVTPQGLMQALPSNLQSPQLLIPTTGGGQQQPQLIQAANLGHVVRKGESKKLKVSCSPGEMNSPTNDGGEDQYDDAQPSTSSKAMFSPVASIQSNKVDSSGLNATPPHTRELTETGMYNIHVIIKP